MKGGNIEQLLAIKDELAYSNFLDPVFTHPTKEARQAIQCMQFGLQYFDFTQKALVDRI